jgi:hypothetical protein
MTRILQHAGQAWIAFLAAIVLRTAYAMVFGRPFDSVYWDLATSLLGDGSMAFGGVAVTDFEPLYPVFLAGARLLVGDHLESVRLIQIVAASAGTLFLYRIAIALDGRPEVAATASYLFAAHPLLIRQAGAGSDLALATTLVVIAAYALIRAATTRRAALAGAALGVLVLARSMTLPLVPLSAAVFLAQRRYRDACAVALTALLFVLPIPLRSYAINGSYWPTRSGLNLFIGNSPHTAALLPDHDVDLLQDHAAARIAPDVAELAEDSPAFSQAADEALARHAWTYMAEDPLRTLGHKLLNVAYFFSPRLVPFFIAVNETRAVGMAGEVRVENARPRPSLEVFAYTAFYAPVLMAALVGVFLRRREPAGRDAILWCVVATFVAIHALYFPATRYRAPMEFVLLFYAAAALRGLTESGTLGASTALRVH